MTTSESLESKSAGNGREKFNTPLVNLAVTHLREVLGAAVFRGRRAPPAEAELASQLGVSRPVLRQALSVLRDEGLVRISARLRDVRAPTQPTHRRYFRKTKVNRRS